MRCFEEAWIPGRTVPSLTGLVMVCIGTRHFRAGLLIVTSLRDWRGGAMQLGSAKRRLFCADSRAIRSFLSYDTNFEGTIELRPSVAESDVRDGLCSIRAVQISGVAGIVGLILLDKGVL
jgi:hypothetical protein